MDEQESLARIQQKFNKLDAEQQRRFLLLLIRKQIDGLNKPEPWDEGRFQLWVSIQNAVSVLPREHQRVVADDMAALHLRAKNEPAA